MIGSTKFKYILITHDEAQACWTALSTLLDLGAVEEDDLRLVAETEEAFSKIFRPA